MCAACTPSLLGEVQGTNFPSGGSRQAWEMLFSLLLSQGLWDSILYPLVCTSWDDLGEFVTPCLGCYGLGTTTTGMV